MTRNVVKVATGQDMQVCCMEKEGYMAMAFRCNRHIQAELVEGIIQHDYLDIRAQGSFKYFDTSSLAERLGVEYESASYESYTCVAQALYVRIVKIFQALWAEEYSGEYGYFYDVKSGESPQSELETSPGRVPITSGRARGIGFQVKNTVHV
jgi:hypothetical protein